MGDPEDILDVAPARREGVFQRGSHVVDYWLAHCEGFTLGKASARRVTGVVCDRHTGHAQTLYVESIRRRPRTVPARSVQRSIRSGGCSTSNRARRSSVERDRTRR